MIMIKKKNLIILLIFAVMSGATATYLGTALLPSATGNTVEISQDDLERYQALDVKYAKLEQLEQVIKDQYYLPVDEKTLQEGVYKGLFLGIGDPYSSYLTKEEYADLMVSTSGEYQGIGITINPDDQGFINVVAPIEDTPADKAGIRSGDKILKVDGKDYTGATIDAAVSAMRGKPGTKVTITVFRDNDTMEFTVARANIVLKSVKARLLDGDLGYIRVTSFDEKTAEEFESELRAMETKGVKGLVIDLRDNPGGLVDASISIADQLLDAGTVTYTEDRQGNRETYSSKAGKTPLPYVILINQGSASASEILAGAVKDNKGGPLVGTTSFGKGIIQSIAPLENGDAIKLTVMQYFSPNGDVIHKIGVTPDYQVEVKDTDYNEDGTIPEEKDQALQKAKDLLLQSQ